MSNQKLPKNLLPVICPRCGESQNTIVGGLNADGLPTGEVRCMVCQNVFERNEYLKGLQNRHQEFERLTGPQVK